MIEYYSYLEIILYLLRKKYENIIINISGNGDVFIDSKNIKLSVGNPDEILNIFSEYGLKGIYNQVDTCVDILSKYIGY